MKRISTVVATAALAALALAGCSASDDPAETAGLRKGTQSESAAPTTSDRTPTASVSAEPTPASDDTGSTVTPATPPSDRATDTTCAEFKKLDEPAQQQLITTILAENPNSAFVGNPSAALGTAKLVCNASKLADQKVSVLAGIVTDN